MAARIFRQWPEPVGSEPGVTQIHGRKAAIKFQRLRSGPWPIRASGQADRGVCSPKPTLTTVDYAEPIA